MKKLTFHLIPNAHLDPVWLWDWREGLNQGIATCRTVLDLMDENPDLTFIRGETAIYEHIERFDPETFARIKKMVKAGRWDTVGGTYIQPDTNLPATETFLRHFAEGRRYFTEKFNKKVTVAWAADSFGHSAGLPEILAASGIESFAFSRPAPSIVPLAKPAFWWQGSGGSRVLAYQIPIGWYGCEREEMPKRLDSYLEFAARSDLENAGVFFGLGDHGGGPTRRQLADIRAWAKKHPEITVKFSGLHALFAALRAEIQRKGDDFLPTHTGEMNFVLRGCYSSVAKFKFAYRRAEGAIVRAEKTDAVISRALRLPPGDLRSAWKGLLFNSFHDILPGSSIERAFDEQIEWIGHIAHDSRAVESAAINRLMMQIDTRVAPAKGDMPQGVPLVIFNPLPRPFHGQIELEASLDDRPIWKYSTREKVGALPVRLSAANGKPMPFQLIDTEHSSMVELAWRKRLIAPIEIPAMGWAVVEMAYDENAKTVPIAGGCTASEPGEISNGIYSVRAIAGAEGIEITRHGKPLLTLPGLSAVTVEDPWGSWGAMAEDKESLDLSTIRDRWKITQIVIRERGPLRAAMWVQMEGGHSRMELTVHLAKDRDAIDIAARVLWNERSARLKLIIPSGGNGATYEVPGGVVTRADLGEVPGGRWVRAGQIAFISDAVYNFDTKAGVLRATVVRASRYANDLNTPPSAEPWMPAVDAGELKFHFILAPADAEVNALSEELEQPPIVALAPAKNGKLKRVGSLLEVGPANIKVLAIAPRENRGLIVYAQEIGGRRTMPKVRLAGKRIKLSPIDPRQIAIWRI